MKKKKTATGVTYLSLVSNSCLCISVSSSILATIESICLSRSARHCWRMLFASSIWRNLNVVSCSRFHIAKSDSNCFVIDSISHCQNEWDFFFYLFQYNCEFNEFNKKRHFNWNSILNFLKQHKRAWNALMEYGGNKCIFINARNSRRKMRKKIILIKFQVDSRTIRWWWWCWW